MFYLTVAAILALAAVAVRESVRARRFRRAASETYARYWRSSTISDAAFFDPSPDSPYNSAARRYRMFTAAAYAAETRAARVTVAAILALAAIVAAILISSAAPAALALAAPAVPSVRDFLRDISRLAPDAVPFILTDAPEDCDYGTATEIYRCQDRRGRVFRLVWIRERGATADRLRYLTDYQAGRYASGLYVAAVGPDEILRAADNFDLRPYLSEAD